MAVLEKLRGWGIVLSILVAIPLLLFIIDPSQVIQTIESVSSKYDVGKIAGKSVSYSDFENDVKKFSTISETLSGNSSSSEQQQQQIRDMAWQSLLDRNLFMKNAKAAGINVGRDEILDLTSGETLSPVMSSNPVFFDETGSFSQDRVVDFLNAVESDQSGRLALVWDYFQESILANQYHTKYNALFTAGSYENALQVKRAIEDNNTTANVDFVMVPMTYAQDSTVTVSDAEIKKFYNDHKNQFRQKASRDIEYAVFEVVPSKEDIAAAGKEFGDLYNEFSTTDNVRLFMQRNSDRQFSDRWYKAGELNSVNREVESFVSANTSGVSPVIMSGNNYLAARILESANVPDSVYVRHILLQGADVQSLADSLLGVVSRKGADFAAVAAVYSDDQGSNADEKLGNIGWMTQNYMIPGMESVLTAKVGAPYIMKTSYGTHIVEVTKTSKPVLKKKVAVFEKETNASKETYNKYYNDANRLATLAQGSLAKYKAACDSIGTYSHPMTITEGTDSYGAISHAKQVTRWAFDNKPGKASNIITVDNKYFFVAAVKEEHKEGYATVAEASPSIRTRLYNEKYAVKKAADIAAQIEGLTDLEAIAGRLGTTVSSQSDVSFASVSRSLDPKFVGAVASAPENEISGPVAGNYGVYVFKVTGRETGSFFTEEDARTAGARVSSYTTQMILPVMMDDADVKDNRERFY